MALIGWPELILIAFVVCICAYIGYISIKALKKTITPKIERICPSCGLVLDKEAKFCSGCGYELKRRENS